MVKRIRMEGGDESHPDPAEVLKNRNAVGAKIMSHWEEFGVALKGRNASEMARLREEMVPMGREWKLHDDYLHPGQSNLGGRTPAQRYSPTEVEKSAPTKLRGGGGGGTAGNKLGSKEK